MSKIKEVKRFTKAEGLYNPEQKLAYINEAFPYEPKTQDSIYGVFKKASLYEAQVGRDIAEMSYRDMDSLLNSLSYITENTIRTALSYYSRYTDWAIANGLTSRKENNVALFTQQADLTDYVSRLESFYRYLTKDEIRIALNGIINDSDKVIFLSFYEGIAGADLHETRTLRIDRLNKEENTVQVEDKNGKTRKVKISQELKKYMLEAYSEDYFYVTAEGDPFSIIQEEELVRSKYIIRPFSSRAHYGETLSGIGLRQRFQKVRRNLGLIHITPRSLYDSNLIQQVSDLTSKKGLDKASKEVINEVATNNNLSRMQEFSLHKKYLSAIRVKDFS